MTVGAANGTGGPLKGVRVVEFAGIGPGPFAGMLLADLGADVVIIDRPEGTPPTGILARGKTSIALDLKSASDRKTALRAIDAADVLIEGFRPGVMERLGLGPDIACSRNPRLIYGRMTGWGQDGPAAQTAGHDLTYIALTGVLAALGPPDRPPPPPLNLIGDFAGGSLHLVMGICAALYERSLSGMGQVIDCAIVDGVACLFAPFLGGAHQEGNLSRDRSLLGGATPSYRCYACADGRYVAVGALEPRFFAELLRLMELDAAKVANRLDPAEYPRIIALFEEHFASRTRDEWASIFAGTDACVSPVLEVGEASLHPHMAARNIYAGQGDAMQPMPAPRFSRTSRPLSSTMARPGEGGVEQLLNWGITTEEIASLPDDDAHAKD